MTRLPPAPPDPGPLIDSGIIRLQRAPPLGTDPPPVRRADLPDRVEGLLLGLAVGDALGAPCEGMTPDRRRSELGQVREYLPRPEAGGRAVGLPSDDTQLAFWTLERLLDDGGLDPDRVLRTFANRRIYGIGATVRAALDDFRAGRPWHEAGQPSAGNGALMRIAPVLLPHLPRPSANLWRDTVILAALTHNDPASTAACVAWVHLLWNLLGRDDVPPPGWWTAHFTGIMAPLEGEPHYRTRRPGIVYEGPMSRFARDQVDAALQGDLSVRDACHRWGSGAYLLETLPTLLLVLARHGHDPEEAIIRAVNDTVDNDTIAALAGAAVGALHGARALPARWRDGLLGRTREDDDGQVFRLIDSAISRWVRTAGGPTERHS
jgi:ADP-ribosyl-[dinitrogen reductase] hydrolase